MYYLCRDPNDGDDLAQQVFLKAWRSIRQLRSSAAFDGWLKKIMVTTWLQEVRRTKLVYADESDLAGRATPPERTGERLDLDAALAQLPPTMRLCIVLAYHNGLTHGEIETMTGLPLGTIKSNISRGSARLRELLRDYRGAR